MFEREELPISKRKVKQKIVCSTPPPKSFRFNAEMFLFFWGVFLGAKTWRLGAIHSPEIQALLLSHGPNISIEIPLFFVCFRLIFHLLEGFYFGRSVLMVCFCYFLLFFFFWGGELLLILSFDWQQKNSSPCDFEDFHFILWFWVIWAMLLKSFYVVGLQSLIASSHCSSINRLTSYRLIFGTFVGCLLKLECFSCFVIFRQMFFLSASFPLLPILFPHVFLPCLPFLAFPCSPFPSAPLVLPCPSSILLNFFDSFYPFSSPRLPIPSWLFFRYLLFLCWEARRETNKQRKKDACVLNVG